WAVSPSGPLMRKCSAARSAGWTISTGLTSPCGGYLWATCRRSPSLPNGYTGLTNADRPPRPSPFASVLPNRRRKFPGNAFARAPETGGICASLLRGGGQQIGDGRSGLGHRRMVILSQQGGQRRCDLPLVNWSAVAALPQRRRVWPEHRQPNIL